MSRRACISAILALLGAVVVVNAATAHSHMTTPTDDTDYLTRQEVDSRLKPDDVDLMGERIDLNTGAVIFEHVDVMLPGNSDLEVALRRRIVPGELRHSGGWGFRDWTIEFPRIITLIARPSTQPSATWKTNRCSGPANPGPVVHYNVTIQPYEYWNGLTLEIPGQGARTILDSATGGHWPAGTAKSTNDNWALKCIPNIGATNGGGEGFIAIAPNGHQYRFDRLFQRHARGFRKYGAMALGRQLGMLVATEVTDTHGNWVRYSYNSNGLPTQISSNDGRVIDIVYSATNQALITAVVANGRTWSYGGTSRLTLVTLPDSRTWTFDLGGLIERGSKSEEECPPPLKTVSIIHPNGATASYTFAEVRHARTYVPASATLYHGPRAVVCGWENRVIPKHYLTMSLVQKTLSGPGYPAATWSYSYSGDGGAYTGSGGLPDTKWTQVIDPLGRKLRHYFERRWVALDRALVREETYATASATIPLEVIDYAYTTEAPVGSFDMANENVNAVRQPRHLTQRYVTRGSDTFNTRHTYDITQSSAGYSFGFPTRTELWSSATPEPRIEDTVYAHNRALWILGLPATITRNGVLFDGYAYDSAGRVTEHRKFGSVASTFGYHMDPGQAGALAWIDDALARRTQFLSYQRGLPQQVVRKDGVSIFRTVDGNGWVTSVTNARGFVTGYQYNPVGWLTYIDRPAAWSDSSVTYSGLGGGLQQTITRGNLRTMHHLDSLLRPYLHQLDDLSGASEPVFRRTTYNALGLVTFQSFPSAASGAANGRALAYDGLLRLTSEGENVAPYAATAHQYLSGHRHRIVDPSGATVTTRSSAYGTPDNGEPVEVIDAMGATTAITRDIHGKITLLTQSAVQNGYATTVTRSFWYDTRQRLCRHRAPETGDELMSYDALDRLTYSEIGQPAGSGCVAPSAPGRIGRTYDVLGRITQLDYPQDTPDATYQYDAHGNITRSERGSAIWTHTYNELDLPATERLDIDGRSYPFAYGYVPGGFVASRTSPSGVNFVFAPDGHGRPTRASVDGFGHVASVAYHPNGSVASAGFGSGFNLVQLLNARQAPQEISVQRANTTTAMRLIYDYDVRGKIAAITDLVHANSDRVFGYDAAGRLVSASGPWGSGSFVYDGSGNLRSQILGTRQIAIGYDEPRNRVASVWDSAAGATRTYVHDARGNAIADGLRTFVYDHANQPTSVSSGSTHAYTYDGNRRRVKSVSAGKTVYTIYSTRTGELLYRDEATDGITTDFVNIGPAGLRLQSNGVATYTHADHLGSPVAATNLLGSVLWRERYAPFGARIDDPPGNLDDPGFGGHLQDSATGLTYMQARYYDPDIGRFLSADPVGYQDDWNLYQYARNDPLNNIDPFGEQACNHQKNCLEATNFKPRKSDRQTVTQSANIDAAAVADLPQHESKGDTENAVRFDESASGNVTTTKVPTMSVVKGNTIESTISGIGGADAIGHSHSIDKSDPSPGPRDDVAVNAGLPNNIVHDQNVIVVEKVNGQFRVRVLNDNNLTKSERKEIQRDVNRFQRRIQ